MPHENVLCVGDEVDAFFGSQFKKHPDMNHSAISEIEATRKEIRRWGSAFPQMKLAISNHGLRWVRKAIDAEIPSQMLRSYQEMIEAPPDWVWKDKWIFKTKHPFCMVHGMGYSGINGHRNAAIDFGISTVIGHLHSHAGLCHIKSEMQSLWAMNVGCMIDADSLAFSYGKYNRQKPVLGCGIIKDSGKTPLFIPYN